MREAFSKKQEVKLNQEPKENKKDNRPKKKTPIKKETQQKLKDMGIDTTKVFFEEDALTIIEEKNTQKTTDTPKRNKKEQIRYEAVELAKRLNIKISEDVGINAILASIKNSINEMKKEAGNDIPKMAEALSYEVSYKAICTENEVYNNTASGLGVSSLADYNRFRLGL